MRPIGRKSRPIAVVAAAAVLAGLALASASLGAGSGSSNASQPSESFAVLRSAPLVTAADLSASAQEWLKVAMVSAISPSTPTSSPTELATTVGPDKQKFAFAVLGEKVCFLDEAVGAGNCGARSVVEEGRIFTAVTDGCNFNVVGMMPDEVSSLSVRTDNGQTIMKEVPVVSNVYSVVLPPQNVTMVDGNGGISVEIPLNAYSAGATEGC